MPVTALPASRTGYTASWSVIEPARHISSHPIKETTFTVSKVARLPR